jgi:hypothetical protein
MTTSRGTLVSYDPATGNGLVSADGNKVPFAITAWKSDSVPRVGMTVEIHPADDGSAAFAPVRGMDFPADPLGRIGGMLTSDGAKRIAGSAQQMTARVGVPVLVAYALLIFGVMVLAAGRFHYSQVNRSVSFTAFEFIGFSWFLQMLTLLALASVAVPYFWKNRLAWLAYAYPALLLFFFAPIFMTTSADDAERYWSTRFSVSAGFMTIEPDSGSFGVGLYVTVAAGIFLAIIGFKNYLKRIPVYH